MVSLPANFATEADLTRLTREPAAFLLTSLDSSVVKEQDGHPEANLVQIPPGSFPGRFMTPERWRQITDLFHAARARNTAVRGDFLDQACAADPTVRAEVDAMLAADGAAGAFGEHPVSDVAHPRSLGDGARLGSYEVVAFVAAGGMGEVYRARDTRLGRDVALKVLPDLFAPDPERLARFRLEAQVLAALNHPHIATLYGLEEIDGLQALILEFVEGPTLADRIFRGAVPLGETLLIAHQIADALATAHDRGVIHRDLKPANIKLTATGTVKVLDFGLAKVYPGAVVASPGGSGTWERPGVVRGTAAYMSPEQARGDNVDKRTDIWAFGCVLYEMLSGRAAFAGEKVSDTLAAILDGEPDWSGLPESTPPAMRRLLESCLEKDVTVRRRDAADLGLEIGILIHEGRSRRGRQPARSARFRGVLGFMVGASVVGALATGVWLTRREEIPPVSGLLVRTSIELPPDAPLALGAYVPNVGFERDPIALSPDGRKLAYVGQASSGTRLYLRDLGAQHVTPIDGTEGVVSAFFSPDSRWIGFLTEDKVKKVAVSGGAPVTLCNAVSARQGVWLKDDSIFFGNNQNVTLERISARGGSPAVVKNTHGDVTVLPDGQHALVTRYPGRASVSRDYSDVALVSLETGASKVLLRSGYDARYVEPGYLVFGRAGSLFAIRFDPILGQTSGEPALIASGVSMESILNEVHATTSDMGVMAYVPGGDRSMGRLAWVDHQGRAEFLPTPTRLYNTVSLSPDGRKLAAHVADFPGYVWVYDIARGEGRRLTTDEREPSGWPIWAPDGRSIAFRAWHSSGRFRVLMQSVEGGSVRELLPAGEQSGYPAGFSGDGRLLAVRAGLAHFSILTLGGRLEQFAAPGVRFGIPDLSPDGRFVAYVTNETGQDEIFVRSLVDGRTIRQISLAGGVEPRWCPCGELFYRLGNRWMSVKIRTTPALQWERAREVFQTDFIDTVGRSYDVSPDGRRLLVVKRAEPDIRTRINLLVNWTAALPQTTH